ncbi:MAG: chromosomal replication initiator protein DnaA [Patescibacteria group bacterium]|nr:chromosomal replication initiator protein DnaA [Patescibacteria group bacterium]MDE2438501.1 chromosomal replication initiator protein DnaA [Patescibacteria group bacterium]
MNCDELWQKILGELELQISKANFITWLKHSSLTEVNQGVAKISLKSNFAKEWVENKYHKQILHLLHYYDNSIRNAHYVIVSAATISPLVSSQKTFAAAEELQLEIAEQGIDPVTNLNAKYNFDHLVIGATNELAAAACYAIIQEVGKKYNPLFIYGGVGVGKTHLLQATGNEIVKKYHNQIKVLYVTSEKFTSDVVTALQTKGIERIDAMKQKYRNADVLIIDDIQFIAGRERTEEEFFNTFNALYNNNKQIILSSDRPPRALPIIAERLKSRFEGGMLADIQFPEYEMRLAILKNKLLDKQCDLPDYVIETIAQKVQKNIRELEGMLTKVIFITRQKGLPPEQEELEKVLRVYSDTSVRMISPAKIIKTTADFFEINEKDVIGHERKKEVVLPRQVAMYLLRKELKASYPFIGAKFGNRDHTTAIHAYNKISNEVAKNNNLNRIISEIIERINNN